jgi:putative tryptophan/tyrosine transport system substrate-binding protein
VRRRDVIKAIAGSAVVWPLAARAQQPSIPVIGLLDVRSANTVGDRLPAFRQGLKSSGYVEGENVAIVYRWAENEIDRLPELTAELVGRKVNVIATVGNEVSVIAKKATQSTPMVFVVSQDPVGLGLVASLARPGGNVTGINFFSGELVGKQLGLLRELVPAASRIGVIVNPANSSSAERTERDVAAVSAVGLHIKTFTASTSGEIDAAFLILVRERYDTLLLASDPFFSSRRVQLVSLATRHAIPAIYSQRDFAEIGGLISYGSSITDAWRQSGAYVGRILAGAKPADLPVLQSNKLELVINAQTARIFGLAVPAALLARADEVIE